MARRIHYWIEKRPDNRVTDEQWEEIKRLEHWYNSEFVWTAGRIAFKMFAVFPNSDNFADSQDSGLEFIRTRYNQLRGLGFSEKDVFKQLEKEGLILLKEGGYRDHCLASGFTRVGGNELNAYLVCEFLLKCSTVATEASICVVDEGRFIKCKRLMFQRGFVRIPVGNPELLPQIRKWVQGRRIFSVVDPGKYDNVPQLKNVVEKFTEMNREDRRRILQDWNWLGFARGAGGERDVRDGYDLNRKVRGLEIVASRGRA